MLSWLVLFVTYYFLYARGKPAPPAHTDPQFQPVKLIVGIYFVAGGIWAAIKLLPGTPTVFGMILLVAFLLAPICAGIYVIRKQLRLLRQK